MSVLPAPLPRADQAAGSVAVCKGTVAQCVIRLDDPAGVCLIDSRFSALAWLLREFTRFGVADFLLVASRETARQIPSNLESLVPRRVQVTVAHPNVGSGTGGALLDVRDQLQDRFLWCDGVMLFDWNLANLLAAAATDAPAVIGRLVQFDGAADAGLGLFRKDLMDYLWPGCCLGNDVLPVLAARGLLRVTAANHRLHPASGGALRFTPAAMSAGADDVAFAGTRPGDDDAGSCLRRRALFLDRDGVINLDHGYVGSRERFEWVDGALDAIRYATEAGWHVFIVSNQSGVARGLFTEDAVMDLMHWISDQARLAGGTIDDVRICPFHPEALVQAYRQAHPWRKPLPGMLLDLISAWDLDPGQAVMVGDQETDMQAAAAAGVAGHLFQGGNLRDYIQPILDQYAEPEQSLTAR